MSHSTKAAPQQIEKWTTEDVHQWLTAEVKVSQICAEKFVEEDVSGDCLIAFEKKDIVDLGIKHGPAVKIQYHLKRIREGPKHDRQFPVYVENWTKDQVYQWLLQHARVYHKYAERLHEEDVCGACLVCFEKEDLLDLDVKSGPTVKILKELNKLKDNPEPTLEPLPPPSAHQRDVSEPTQTELKPSQQPQPFVNTDLRQQEINRNAPDDTHTPVETVREDNKTQHPGKQLEPKPLGSDVKQKTHQPQTPNCWDGKKLQSSLKIQKILQDLLQAELKEFNFHLQEYCRHNNNPIPRGKLEGKDFLDTTKLLIDHFGNEDALHVTHDILIQIDQRQLATQLEKEIGPLKLQCSSDDTLKRECHQGDKLKNLLTCGGKLLENYDGFVVIVNKSQPGQVEHLQFLSKLKLFCVLDLDPNSNAPGGVCHSYRETRVANLHIPSQYQGETNSVITKLNLYQQTSWVFCNGRNDIDDEFVKELDYKNWLKKFCSDVEQLVSFICTPDVLDGRSLIIFLLLSPVDTEKDPIFDIYKSFFKRTNDENIITISESQGTYLKWKELIQEKCDTDIDILSIYELTLSQVNGTVMTLQPFNQTCEKLLPSSDSSAVVLKQKDEDLMTALDIWCLNQCENCHDENSSEFDALRIKVEEEFYRGGKVKCWNFYFCDKDKDRPFIKRDKYESLKKLVRNQHDTLNTCVLLSFFHYPGCGGTTLAMHVMWDLRKEFRCAVLKDNTLSKEDVADQVIKLMKLQSGKPSPVLLLVDDLENAHELVNCIHNAQEDYSNRNGDDTKNRKVIILNCVRSNSPEEQYKKQDRTQSQYITASLTPKEQRDFEKKLMELKETHEKPENFYTFMFMKSNFDGKYTADLARNTLESFDFNTKAAQLFAFLALLNTYIAKSEISLSNCKDFCEINMRQWHEDNVLERLKPYSNLLTIVKVRQGGAHKGVRILHHLIATACLEELEKSCLLKVSDIAMEILDYDVFFRDTSVKSRFLGSFRRMLVERQRKKDGDEREPFSPFIDKVHNQEGRQTVQCIFEKASFRFETRASIPQALARYLYINERDFPEALKWAEKAKNISENPYTLDTIGQIHKSNLKSNIDREKQETSHEPDDLKTNIKIAEKAITAFKRAQELAITEDEQVKETAEDDSEDYPKNSYNVYGYVGVLDIAFLVFEILGRLPFFEESDPNKKNYLKCFLEKEIPILNMCTRGDEVQKRYVEIIRDNEHFLLNLKSEVKDIFELLEDYYTYMKTNTSEFESKNRSTVTGHFRKYVALFCTEPEKRKKERQNNPNLSVKIVTEERRLFLEKKHADTFAGILQQLDKPPEEIERITKCYAFLQEQQQFVSKSQKTKETTNYLLSNIILNLLKPTSEHVKDYTFLSNLLLKTLHDVGPNYRFPDPYYLALLLFWPSPSKQNPEIDTYVRAIRHSSRKRLNLLVKNRGTVAHVYLGRGKGFKRLVSKPQLDKNFRQRHSGNLAQLWRSGDIFKYDVITSSLHRVSGTIEQGEVYAAYEKLKIPVHPALNSAIRSGCSTENVSFYLGFAINGPLAYDIQYEN